MLQRHARLKGHRLEGEQTAQRHLAHGRLRPVGRLAGGIRLGQKEQIVHQLLHLLRLVVGVLQPFGLGGHRVFGMGEDEAGIGQNDGEGGFQLVGGVGHKLALLLPRPFRRAQGHGGEDKAHEKETHHGQGPHQQGQQGQIAQGGSLPAQIGKGDAELAVGPALHQKAQAKLPEHALTGAGGLGLLHRLGGGLLRNVHLAAVVEAGNGPVLHGDHKNRDQGEAVRPVRLALLRRRAADFKAGRPLPLLPGQGQPEGGIALPRQATDVRPHKEDEHHRQHQAHQQQVDQDEFPPQPLDHTAGTSR